MSKRVESISHQSPKEIENYINRISEEREEYRSLLECVGTGICLCDFNAEIFFANKLFFSLFNYEIDKSLQPFFKAISDEKLRGAFSSSLHSNRIYDEEFTLHNGSNVIYIHIHGFPFSEKYYAYFASDITERKKELYELKRLESLAALSNVAAVLAHDINNPLSAISVQSDLLSRGVGRKDADFFYEHIDIVKNEIDRIRDIVRNFLFSARSLEVTPLLQDPLAMIENIVSFIRPDMEANGIELRTEIKKPLPYVDMDYNMIYSCVINLVKNSIEAMEGSDKKTVTLSASRIMNDFVISVADTGCGISDSVMENIFKPYFTTKKTGTGLGLSCVYKIVKMHSGDVRVKRLETGTEISIVLPLRSTDSLGLGEK